MYRAQCAGGVSGTVLPAALLGRNGIFPAHPEVAALGALGLVAIAS